MNLRNLRKTPKQLIVFILANIKRHALNTYQGMHRGDLAELDALIKKEYPDINSKSIDKHLAIIAHAKELVIKNKDDIANSTAIILALIKQARESKK